MTEWLEHEKWGSSHLGRVDGMTASWMEPTPDLMEAVRSMGPAAIPQLVEIGLNPAPRERLRTVLEGIEQRMSWMEMLFRSETWRRYTSRGQSLPELARAVICELRPSANDLHPWLTNRLSEPYALMMLSDVSEEREAAAAILNRQPVQPYRWAQVYAVAKLGQAGAAAMPALVSALAGREQVGRRAFRYLCLLGPAAVDSLPELHEFFDQECNPEVRIDLALLAGDVDPGPFWAESELREELLSTDAEWVGYALAALKEWPYLVPRFEGELRWIAMTGSGFFDSFEIEAWRRSEMRRSLYQYSKAAGAAYSPTDLASRARELLARREP